MRTTSSIDKKELDVIDRELRDIARQLGRSSNKYVRAGIEGLKKLPPRMLAAVGMSSGSPKLPRIVALCGSSRFRLSVQGRGGPRDDCGQGSDPCGAGCDGRRRAPCRQPAGRRSSSGWPHYTRARWAWPTKSFF